MHAAALDGGTQHFGGGTFQPLVAAFSLIDAAQIDLLLSISTQAA